MWVQVLLWVVTTLISWAMQPKPQRQKPAAMQDIQANTAENGREIGVLFGTRDVAPNWVWYGNLKAKPIKKSGGKK